MNIMNPMDMLIGMVVWVGAVLFVLSVVVLVDMFKRGKGKK